MNGFRNLGNRILVNCYVRALLSKGFSAKNNGTIEQKLEAWILIEKL